MVFSSASTESEAAQSSSDGAHTGTEREPLLRGSRSTSRLRLPWWKKPSVWWVLPLTAMQMLAVAMIVGPMMEMVNRMACRIHRPDIGLGDVRHPGWMDLPPNHPSLPIPSPSYPWLKDSDEASLQAYDLLDWTGGNKPHNKTRSEECDADPTVQRAVADFITATSVVVGVIVVSVTGWWSVRSDMWGRKLVCTLMQGAGLASFVGMIIVAKFGHSFPGIQYWWLLPIDIIASFLGGLSNTAVAQAYISDATDPANRAAVFALSAGITMGAIAIGPVIGAQLIHHTGDLLSVYYLGTAFSILGLIMWIFVIPESLSPERRAASVKQYSDEQRARSERQSELLLDANRWKRWGAMLTPNILIEVLAPLAILLPSRNEESGRRDWSLTWIAITALIFAMGSGVQQFAIQLAKKLFFWGAEEIGYWLSVIGGARAIYLLLVFPVIVRAFKPKPAPISLDGPEYEPNTVPTDEAIEPAKTSNLPIAEFDLRIARISAGLDALGYAMIAASQTSRQFMVASASLSVGGGLMPSLMSLALFVAP
ncbi:MFS general substrate transporter, partial [Auriculariales sp. MPI-PUGE-AT-0066]